ncbi:MAG: tetratricopeptide repeat protein [Isosphaerales bacterium]
MRSLNLVFLAILLAVVTVFGGGMHLVHETQIRRNASVLLDRARRAEAGNKLDKAEETLSQYLSINRDDGPTWVWYARVVDRRDSEGRRRERVFLVQEQALRYNPDDLKLERRCADLALELKRYNDAERHLDILLEQLPKDSQGQPAKVELAELEDLLGQCDRGLTRFEEAEKWFVQALEHDPSRVSCYDRLARLRRNDLRRNVAGDGTIKEMVANNPKVGQAYVYRWRYFAEFLPPPDASDLQEALKLAPDDPEVLFTAAIASEQKPDAAAARVYFEKGWKLDPKNAAFAIRLAGLELREQHTDRAEKVLRQAYEARPSVDLAFLLAEDLIIQGKIEGKDQAGDYIALLRNAGLGDTSVRYLEARILFQQQKWAEAIPKLEMARAVLKSDSGMTSQLNLMLADCYKRQGSDEQRLDALRQAAESEQSSGSARVELARALAQSGKLDQALVILLPLAERQPELTLEIVRLLIQKTLRQPGDRRDWREIEQRLLQTEKARPQDVEALTFLRVDMLAAQNHQEDARSLLASAQAKDPRNLPYRLALARLTQRQGKGPLALQILDQAEKDLGPSPDIQLARLDSRGLQGGDEASVVVAKLAETRNKIPAADQLAFLDQLARTEIRLRELPLARQYWRELAVLQPNNLRVLLGLFDLAMEAADHADASDLVRRMRKVEGEQGTFWRFGQAVCSIDQARRGGNEAPNAIRADLDVIRALASEIAERRPDWWGGPLLQAEIAEFDSRHDDAIASYQRAIDLGNSQPAIVRRLAGLLSDRNRFDDIDRLVASLRDRGIPAADLTIATAFNAIRNKDYERGLALARQVIPARSTRYTDHLNLGRMLWSSGNEEEAGKEFRQALDLAPSVPETWRSWVAYLASTNQTKAAREAVAAAKKALPPEGSALTLAQCLWSAGEVNEAESFLGKALKARPGDAATLRLAANFFLDQNRPDQAGPLVAELLKPAIGASKADMAWARRAQYMLGFASGVKPEQVEQTLGLVEENLKSDPNDLDEQRMRAVLLSMRYSRRKESIQALESMDRTRGLAPREQFLLAMLYSVERDWPKCRAEMLKILENRPRQPRHLAFYVNLMIRLGELDEAERWLQTLKLLVQPGAALELEASLLKARNRALDLPALIRNHLDQNPDLVGRGAFLLERFGLLKEAEPAYRAYVARNPNEPERILALVEFLTRQDRPQEALGLCELAMKTCRPEAVTLTSLAIYEAKSASEPQRRKVEAWLREMVHKKPDDVVLRTKLATLCTRQGNYAEAEAIYRRLLGANQDNVEVLNNLAWQLALRDHKSKEALTLVDRAIDIAGRNPALLDTRAVVLMQLSQGDKALQDIRDAVSSEPDKPVRYFHLARAFHMTNAHADARKALERSEALGLKEQTVDPLERESYRRLCQEMVLR